jgi:hypothetical protein
MGHHGDDLAAKDLGVGLERFLALTIEGQIGVHLHDALLAV